VSFTAADHEFMARALQLARRGLETTTPNPRVGCVLMRDGVVIGEGWHERAGGPHAEVRALAVAGSAAGATAYVTLEPCSHHGRTPPCADALIAAGVARVVAAMEDPNPQVAGEGLARLAAAGISTASGLLAAEARELNLGFVSRMTRGRPWLRLKAAASLDGKTALNNGKSQEAGFKLNGSLLREGCVDELLLYLAPMLLGDAARGLFDLPELTELAGRRELAIVDSRQLGPDLRLTARLK